MLPLVLSGGLIPGQTRNGLESIQMNLVGAINFTDYERLLNQEAVNFDVEEVYNNLTQIATLQANMVHNNISNQKCRTCNPPFTNVQINKLYIYTSHRIGVKTRYRELNS